MIIKRLLIFISLLLHAHSFAKIPLRLMSALKRVARTTNPKTTSGSLQFQTATITRLPKTQYTPRNRFVRPLALGTVTTSALAVPYFYKTKQEEAKKQELHAYNQDIMTIFAHGMKSSAKAGLHRHVSSQRPGAFIQGAFTTFDFKDVAQVRRASLGQEDDVKQLEETCLAFSGQRKVLVGSSRGAATCINYVGTRNNPEIGAVVVESPFASLETLVNPRFKRFFKLLFPEYSPHGLQPVATASTISKNVPVLLFCSKDDEIIPVSQTIQVYNALKASGHTQCHLLVVDHGAHAKILHDKDAITVRNAIHAFYKTYTIPHNAEWAQAGYDTFKSCQPTAQELEKIATVAAAQASSWKTIMRLSGGSSGSR